jgi:hypothetical protein
MPFPMPSAKPARAAPHGALLFLVVFGAGTLLWMLCRGGNPLAGRPRAWVRPPAAVAAGAPAAAHPRPPVLPRYPAISAVSAHAAELNGVPVFTESYLCHDSAAEVMDYYLAQLTARGWEDQTEGYFKLTPCLSDRARPPAEQQEFAVKYDYIRSTQAVLVKPGESLNLTIEPRGRGGCKVNLNWAGTPDLVGFWRSTLRASAAAPEQPRPWFESVADAGAGGGRMRFYTGSGTPDELVAAIAAQMRRDGWSVRLPAANSGARGSKLCLFERGSHWALASARAVAPHRTTGVLAEH